MNINNKNGIKYFIYLLSLNKDLPYLPREVREIIWKKYFTSPVLSCIICNDIIINFEVYIFDEINTESAMISNGYASCWPCRYYEDSI